MSPELQLTLLCIGCFLAGAACCQVANWYVMGVWMFGRDSDDMDTKPAQYTGDKYL